MQEGGFVAPEGKFHILSGEGVAVVKLDALAELEFIDPLVVAHRPRLGQRGGHEIARHRLDQGIMQRVENPKERLPAHGHLARIEPGGREGHVEGPAHLPGWLGLCCGAVAPPQEEAGHETQRHESPAAPGPSWFLQYQCHTTFPVHITLPPVLWRQGGWLSDAFSSPTRPGAACAMPSIVRKHRLPGTPSPHRTACRQAESQSVDLPHST